MTALVDVAIAILVATSIATFVIKLPLAAQSSVREVAGALFFAILKVNSGFVGNTRDELKLKPASTRETFLFVWLIAFVLSLFACAYSMGNWLK